MFKLGIEILRLPLTLSRNYRKHKMGAPKKRMCNTKSSTNGNYFLVFFLLLGHLVFTIAGSAVDVKIDDKKNIDHKIELGYKNLK